MIECGPLCDVRPTLGEGKRGLGGRRMVVVKSTGQDQLRGTDSYRALGLALGVLLVLAASAASAQPVLTISRMPPASVSVPPPDSTNPPPPITWNVVGLDSNSPGTTTLPHEFLAGARVCNTGSATATNLVATFMWDEA